MGSLGSMNPMAMGIGAAASFVGSMLSAHGPSQQMQALNAQVQDFTQSTTSLAKQEGLSASTVFQNLMTPLQRIVSGGPSQAGWSQAQVNAFNTQAIQRGATTARDLSAISGGGPGGMGGISVGNATGAGVNNKFAAAQAAEAQTSAAESQGTINSAEAGRSEFNTAVGEEQKLPSVYETANQGATVAGNQQQLAEKSQQNIDTQKASASIGGRIGGGLSAVGGALLGGKGGPPAAPPGGGGGGGGTPGGNAAGDAAANAALPYQEGG
jgi:hypothetical protein